MFYRAGSSKNMSAMRTTFRNVLTNDSLRMRAARGVMLTGLAFGTQNILRLAGNLVLTRLLFPEAFGLMAIVFIVISAINNLSDLGIKSWIVQDDNGDKSEYLNSAWVLQILRGLLIALLIWAFSGLIADFYEQPLLAQLLPIAGIGALLEGFNSTKLATAERTLQLGRVTVLQITTQVIGLAATVILALTLQSVWALVLGYLVGALSMAVLSHIVLNGHRDRFVFYAGHARSILGFGSYIFIASIAGFIIAQGDRAILGKITTLEELALYNIAFFLASVPVMLARAMIDKIIFPLYSRRPTWESFENRKKIALARYVVTSGGIAALMVFSFIGEPFVELLYDPRYHDAGQFVVLISLALMPGLVTASYMVLALAAGQSGRFAVMAVSGAVVQTLCMLLGGTWYGVVGVAGGLALAPFLYHPITVALTWKYRGWDPVHDLLFGVVICAFAAFHVAQGTLAYFGL